MDAPYRNTLTFVVSAGMVSASLAAAQRTGGAPLQSGGPLPDKLMGLDSSNWCLDAAGSATSTPADGLQAVPRQWSGAGSMVQPFVDDASPISSSSRFVNLQGAGSLTPSSVESGRLFADSNSQQQQQLARLLAVQRQQQEVRKQLVQAPQQRQQLSAQLGLVPSTAAQKQGAVQWTWQQSQMLLLQQQQQQTQQQQVALLPQSSGSSFSSSGSLTSSGLAYGTASDSFSSNPAMTSATTTAWQQLLRHQQLQLQQQPGQQVVQLIPAARTLQSVGSTGTQLVKRLAAPISLDQQPAAKKAATQAAMTALLQGQAAATAAWRPAAHPQAATTQQQLVLLPAVPSSRQTARLPPTGLLRTRQQQQQQVATGPLVTLVSAPSLAAASAGIAVPMRVLEPAQQKLLQWAGRVLNCQLQDAYLLGTHLYQRVTGQLDDMLLISLGVTASTESVTMLVSLWVASKLEGHRRQVAGASKLAAALQLLPGSITDIELHVMQRLAWQPYAGWAARSF